MRSSVGGRSIDRSNCSLCRLKYRGAPRLLAARHEELAALLRYPIIGGRRNEVPIGVVPPTQDRVGAPQMVWHDPTRLWLLARNVSGFEVRNT
jgi:hypothetical protein